MRKLITFSKEQWDYFIEARDDSRQTNSAAFIMQLLNERVKRPVGRPRQTDREELPTEDDVPMYKVPDKHTTSPYSYNDLVAWYDAHPEEGEMPDRAQLVLHKDFKSSR